MEQLQNGRKEQRGNQVEECCLVIDGGTTNTRFVLVNPKSGEVLARMERRVGATDAASISSNEKLKESVKAAITELQKKNKCVIKQIYASGMITSNAGLYELSHIEAPATAGDIRNGIKTVILPEVGGNIEFHFIPGVKFQNQREIGIDMMRGEEVEIFGALEAEDFHKSVMFIHFGSHNKLISVQNGVICNAVTTISGELIWAIAKETILKSSIGSFKEAFEMDEEYVKLGYYETKKSNISRALFVARIHQVMNKATPEQVKSYLYGAMTFIDFQAFSELMTRKTDKIVLYGRETFIEAFKICIPLWEEIVPDGICVREIGFAQSEQLSLNGIRTILSNCLEEAERSEKIC